MLVIHLTKLLLDYGILWKIKVEHLKESTVLKVPKGFINPSGVHTSLQHMDVLKHPLRVKNPNGLTDCIWTFSQFPNLHSPAAYSRSEANYTSLNPAFVLSVCCNSCSGWFHKGIVCFCVCLVCDTPNLSRDTKQPMLPVSLIRFNPSPDGCVAPQHVIPQNALWSQT